ncbi:MAG TPA: metallophosphoesterase [Rubrobacteraceae bacterium]|nr:metallophosphoesterase [Rubrobacteraceae bacterium]
MQHLPEDALLVFVSDSHIGGDAGCDGFESPAELEALFAELAGREGSVELILAGDFFDFLQISKTPAGMDRAAATISRPEYESMFAALKGFASREGKRVVYMPGNHDAEMWWNPEIGETLRGRGLVHELALSYSVSLEVGGERRVVYCEHGNQFDPANTVDDYTDRLDTPLGHHVVTDFTRRVAPFGEISRGLDLSEIKMVYPLTAIPGWIASRYFYDLLGKVLAYLLVPLLVVYAVYRVAAYALLASQGDEPRIIGSFRGLPSIHELVLDLGIFGLLTVVIFALFFLTVRRWVRRTLAAMGQQRRPRYSPAEASQEKVREVLRDEAQPPMDATMDPTAIDVFVSGHTHLPSLDEVERSGGKTGVMVNSGCWLRQLQPVSPRLKGPPIFVSRFVLTHVRVYARGSTLRVELWEHPKPAEQSLTKIERLLSPHAQGSLAGSRPRLRAATEL